MKKKYIFFDHLTVANKYKISYPGYNDILTGKVNPNIKSNKSVNNSQKTFFEKYNLKPTLSFGWVRFKQIYNISRSHLNIPSLSILSRKKYKQHKYNSPKKLPICSNVGLPKSIYKNIDDCLTFEMFLNSWFKNNNSPKCGHLGFLASDEWAHRGDWYKYIKSISYYDECINYLWKKTNPETIIITTDHGRGDKYWKNHYNNLPRSERTWCIIISQNKNKLNLANQLLEKHPYNISIYKLLELFIIQ